MEWIVLEGNNVKSTLLTLTMAPSTLVTVTITMTHQILVILLQLLKFTLCQSCLPTHPVSCTPGSQSSSIIIPLHGQERTERVSLLQRKTKPWRTRSSNSISLIFWPVIKSLLTGHSLMSGWISMYLFLLLTFFCGCHTRKRLSSLTQKLMISFSMMSSFLPCHSLRSCHSLYLQVQKEDLSSTSSLDINCHRLP